jgi:hypothetical protein
MELFREYGAGELNPRARVGDAWGVSWSRIIRISWRARCISSFDDPTRRKRILVCWENARDMSGSLRGSARFGRWDCGVAGTGVEEVGDRRRRTKRRQDSGLKASKISENKARWRSRNT